MLGVPGGTDGCSGKRRFIALLRRNMPGFGGTGRDLPSVEDYNVVRILATSMRELFAGPRQHDRRFADRPTTGGAINCLDFPAPPLRLVSRLGKT